LYKNLGVAVILGSLVAVFGWIMVASGLVHRPWVNGYKLTIHLNLALLLYAWLLWVAIGKQEKEPGIVGLKKLVNVFSGLIIAQFLLGGLMSGMKAGLYYPTWPDMHGAFLPNMLIDSDLWSIDRVVHYENGPVPGVVQFLHRLVAYLIFILIGIIYWKSRKRDCSSAIGTSIQMLFLFVIFQICLGILTVINCVGQIPFILGVAHQITAILLLSNLIYLHRKL
jgi:cytochrome c oxidase assembly protein subunit 15